MSGRAKTLTPQQLNKVLLTASELSADPLRDYAAILLSFRAGLRACEIAGLSWKDVMTADGEISDTIEVPPGIAKKGAGGAVPMHDSIRATLQAMRKNYPAEHLKPKQPIVRGRHQPRMSANFLQKRMAAVYEKAGMVGVTSHSGRRTFLTTLARNVNTYGCSIYDVQDLARHSNISTTEAYVEASEGVGKMVRAL